MGITVGVALILTVSVVIVITIIAILIFRHRKATKLSLTRYQQFSILYSTHT